jgi:hypothetical protein
VAAELGRLATLARERGFRVFVAAFPYLDDLGPEAYHDERAWVAGAAARSGFGFLDLLPAFRECAAAGTGPVGLDRYHPTAVGHACAARAVSAALVPLLRHAPE